MGHTAVKERLAQIGLHDQRRADGLGRHAGGEADREEGGVAGVAPDSATGAIAR